MKELKALLAWGGILALVLGTGLGEARTAKPKKVFIVASYERGNVCGQPQEDGVIAALQDAGFKLGEDVIIYRFYMDTKRTYTTPEQIEERGRIALEKIRETSPDVVVTLDDNAAKTVMLSLVGSKTPVVFSGMNGQPEDYNKKRHFMESRERPGGNVTGVYEKLHLIRSLKVMKAVIPGLKKVLAISDYSPTGQALIKQFEKELEGETPPVAFEVTRARDFSHYKEIIHKVNGDSEIGAIYPVALRLEADGKTYTAPEIFRWTIKNCRKPGMAVNYFFAKLGLFGGAAVDFRAMGYQAGMKVVEILKGRPAGEIPIEDAKRYAIVFNIARAKELGIEIPAEILGAADIIYKEILPR